MSQPPDRSRPPDGHEITEQTREQRRLPSQSGVGDGEQDLSVTETTPPETVPAPSVLQETRQQLYRRRLEQVWAAAHRGAAADPAEHTLFMDAMSRLEAMAPVDDEERALDAVLDLGHELPEGLEGDPATVQLLVGDWLRREPEQRAAVSFIGGVLAPTLDRLELERQGTPEQRVDIVVRALQRLRSAEGSARLAAELLRYLQNQPDDQRSVGFYQTVANLGIIASAAADFEPAEEVFMYHSVLAGVRTIALQEEWDQLSPDAASVVSTSAFNMAATIATLAAGEDPDGQAAADPVVADLKFISAVTVEMIALDDRRAHDIVDALGFVTAQPAAFLSVLLDIGAVASAWQRTQMGLSRLEAASGVAQMLGDPHRAASRLFNAGVSLLRAQQQGERADVLRENLLSRMLFNALGLRCALQEEPDLPLALSAFSGLNCAVNLLGAFVEFDPVADAAVKDQLRPLMDRLVSLSRLAPLRDRATSPIRAGLARLGGAGERLGIRPDATVASLPDFEERLNEGIDVLARALDAPRSEDNPVLDNALIVGRIFAVLPPTEEPEDLQALINNIAADREKAVSVLISRYARYANPTPAMPLGRGPLVIAQLRSEQDWSALTAHLREPIPSLRLPLRAYAEVLTRA